MIGANLRFGSGSTANSSVSGGRQFQCHPGGATEAAVVFSLGALGMAANVALMALILAKRQLRRWSQGLVFHQALVDCARAAILLPLAVSILRCQPVHKCSLVETAFLLLVTVSTVNMLTTVLNDSPVFPQDDESEEQSPLLMDSPQCVLFGTFMIWFASITINLGPTFLSGALAASAEVSHNAPSCPLVHGPFRHYVLNVLWIAVNVVCVLLTLFHLHKLHRDLTKANVQAVRVAGLVTTLVSVTGGSGGGAAAAAGAAAGAVPRGLPPGAAAPEKLGGGGGGALAESRRMRNYLQRVEREGVQRVKMFLVITAAYVVFWGPLFLVTLVHRPALGSQLGYEITLHVAYVHAFVQPTLFLVLHHGLRQAALESCCRPRRPPPPPLPPPPPAAAALSMLKAPQPPPPPTLPLPRSGCMQFCAEYVCCELWCRAQGDDHLMLVDAWPAAPPPQPPPPPPGLPPGAAPHTALDEDPASPPPPPSLPANGLLRGSPLGE